MSFSSFFQGGDQAFKKMAPVSCCSSLFPFWVPPAVIIKASLEGKFRSRHKHHIKKKRTPNHRSISRRFSNSRKAKGHPNLVSSVQLWQYLALEDLWQLYNPFRVNLPPVVTHLPCPHSFQGWLVGWLRKVSQWSGPDAKLRQHSTGVYLRCCKEFCQLWLKIGHQELLNPRKLQHTPGAHCRQSPYPTMKGFPLQPIGNG